MAPIKVPLYRLQELARHHGEFGSMALELIPIRKAEVSAQELEKRIQQLGDSKSPKQHPIQEVD